ncbi:cyclin-dependent kinase regulatory subunit [Phlegmacium glaucopus]|nr:cyclin-dependent kinase regulatory subunit [Phlegmacium glaucopus]
MATQTAQTAQQQAAQQKELARKLEEYIEKIHYSDRYSDDEYEYRHVILPKQLLKMIPKEYFSPDDSGVLRLLTEHEWRGIGITQSLGWEHYEVHAPEPHVLLFRRAKDFVVPTQQATTRFKDTRRK